MGEPAVAYARRIVLDHCLLTHGLLLRLGQVVHINNHTPAVLSVVG